MVNAVLTGTRGKRSIRMGETSRRNTRTSITLRQHTRLVLNNLFLLLFIFANNQGLAQELPSEALSVGPHSTVRSGKFHLKPGSTVNVTAESRDTQFAVDLYVYGGNEELVGKDEEEATSVLYSWVAPIQGEYYVLARNLNGGSGSITVTVTEGKGAPNTELPTHATREIYFATDRNLTGKSAVGEIFGTEPDSNGQLHFGRCLVRIPRGHKMGELEGPSILKLEFRKASEKYVTLLSVDVEPHDVFFHHVADDIQNHSKRHELFVFVHGFNTTFEDAAKRTAQLAYDLGFNGPAILYSWPSQGRVSPIAYNMDGTNAELTARRLEQFLQDLATQSGATTIHLIAHSMGNRPLTSALQRMAIAGPSERLPIFNEVALMAPDISASVFKQLAAEIRPSAQRITLYASSKDEALKASSTFAGYPRAGQGGSSILVVPGVDTIDASAVDTSVLGLFHQYYADNRTVLSDLFHLLQNEAPDIRFGLKKDITSAGVYWEFKAVAR